MPISFNSQHLSRTVMDGLIGDDDRRAMKGVAVGLELEVEGTNLPQRVLGWRTTRDGSLRGESAEYVTDGAVIEKNVEQYLNYLWQAFKASKAKLNQSYRTSFHVHYNCQDLSQLQAFNVFLGFLVCEPLLETVVNEDRVNNVFCLSHRSSSAGLRRIYESLQENTSIFAPFRGDRRYSSINLCSLYKFGTIEIRLMHGLDDEATANLWTKTIIAIGKYFSDVNLLPANIIELPSQRGIEGMFKDIFPGKALQDYLKIDEFINSPAVGGVFDACRQTQAIAYDFHELFKEVQSLVIAKGQRKAAKGKRPAVKIEDDFGDLADVNQIEPVGDLPDDHDPFDPEREFRPPPPRAPGGFVIEPRAENVQEIINRHIIAQRMAQLNRNPRPRNEQGEMAINWQVQVNNPIDD